MAETTEVEQPVADATTYHFCFLCGATCVRGVWEGMPGWQCTDPDCGFFEID